MIGTIQTGAMTVEQVVSKIIANIRKGRNNVNIRKLAGKIVRNIESRDRDLVAKNIYEFLRKNIKYTNDPRGGEFLQDPVVTLKTQTGDCDEFTTLGASLLESIGVKTRVVIVKQNGAKTFSHVYLEYWSDRFQRWIAFDAIVDQAPGWESPSITEKRIYSIETGKPEKSANIGAGEASATVLAANAALASTGVGLPAAVALQAAAAVVDVVSVIIPKKYLTANWWGGKHSIWGKAFGKGYSISAQRANEALYSAFHEPLGYELSDFDGFQKRHKGAFTVWVKWPTPSGIQRFRSRFGDGGTAEMIREIGAQIQAFPKPGFPAAAWKEAAQIVAEKYKTTAQPIPGTQTQTAAGQSQDWPVMPPNPEGINSLNVVDLGKSLAATTTTAGQLYVKAKSMGISESAPTPPVSVLYSDVVRYWNQVNEYRNRLIAKTTGQPTGGDTGIQEAGMSTGGKIAIGLIGTAVLAGMISGKKRSSN